MRCLDVAILDAGQMGASGLKVMKPLTDYKATGPSQWKSSLSLSLQKPAEIRPDPCHFIKKMIEDHSMNY